jgi:hypothetical protein
MSDLINSFLALCGYLGTRLDFYRGNAGDERIGLLGWKKGVGGEEKKIKYFGIRLAPKILYK